jgi:hypothetical protein
LEWYSQVKNHRIETPTFPDLDTQQRTEVFLQELKDQAGTIILANTLLQAG